MAKCEVCGRKMRQPHYGRPKRYCSDRCRQRACRERQWERLTKGGKDDGRDS